MPRGPVEPFKKRLTWILDQMKKRGLEVGGIRVDPDTDTFSVFTPNGAPVEESAFEKWKKQQEEANV